MTKNHRALLIIDVQNEYFDGRLPIAHPGGHLENILRAMDAARAKKIPTAVIQHGAADPDSPIFRKGSAAWQLHPEVAARPRSQTFEKTMPGSFTGTDLDMWLRGHDVETIAIAGYMTHMCCDTTARQGMHRGFRVEFLSDATGTLALDNSAGKVTAEELHRSILCAQQMMISEVLGTSSWLERL